MSKIVNKQYLVMSKGYEYTVTLIKNEHWRWWIESLAPRGSLASFSYKSNALTHWGAINETDKRLADLSEKS